MPNPYEQLPEEAFWRSAVATRSLFQLDRVWDPKFDLRTTDKFVTFGSCFAQHIGRALSSRGFLWHDAEPAPAQLSAEKAKKYNYGVFSARTGNIYTTSILDQWARWAAGEAPPNEFWEGKDGRVIDPFRPAVEPGGFASADEARMSRDRAVAAFRSAIVDADYFIFTLGLTESWRHAREGHEYPMCPGTVAGTFDPDAHAFVNLGYAEVLSSLQSAMATMTALNPKLRFLLTVSPVPLTATNSGRHVMVATMRSKSILRAVAAELAESREDVDYFPSYELINSPVTKAVFYRPNQREVDAAGVSFVMDCFFNDLKRTFGADEAIAPVQPIARKKERAPLAPATAQEPSAADLVCEEELLQAFGR